MNVWERAHQIKGILYGHCQSVILNVPSIDINERHSLRDSGTIIIDGIKFNDGSLLNFFEEIHTGNIERYSYEYVQPTGFFFLYENEGVENGIKKPLHHLHVGIMKEHADESLLRLLPGKLIEHEGPHFKAPEMEFHEFMGMIIANFFSEHDDCEEMLGNLGLT